MTAVTGGVTAAKVEVSIRFEQRADAAAAAVLRSLLDVVGSNLEGAVAGADAEYLHQLRVAVRRARTVQRQFRGVFPALELPGYRAEFRWLQQATGEVRDLDVHLDDFGDLRKLLVAEERDDLAPLRTVLEHDRAAAAGRLTDVLRSRRLLELFSRLGAAARVARRAAAGGPARRARRSIGSLTGERVARVYGRIVKMGKRIDDDSPAESYHEVRKKGKELRYLLELFAVHLFPGDAVDPLIGSLKEMQEVLGPPPGPRGPAAHRPLTGGRGRGAAGRRGGVSGDGRAHRPPRRGRARGPRRVSRGVRRVRRPPTRRTQVADTFR